VSTRATTTLGTVLLVAVAVTLAATVGGVALAAVPALDGPASVSLDVTASADGRVVLTHRGGPALDVRELRVQVSVDGDPLSQQPPVPFFAAPGFHGGPTGPFNAASGDRWTAGERAGFRVAGTNDPPLRAGDTVRVRVYRDGTPVGTARATVQPAGQAASRSALPAASASPSSGARASVTIARGLPGRACIVWCSTSTKPASANIRSASASS
jgi:FlaG/FlaF family flagellin (archaellin)